MTDQPGPDGQPTYEFVAAHAVADNQFRLFDSPCAVFGCAKDDLVEIHPDGTWRVVERGGRISLQVFAENHADRAREEVLAEFARFGATLDNRRRSGAFVVSMPLTVGSQRISSFMNDLRRRYGELDWFYGNALSPDGSGAFLEWAAAFLRS